MSATRCGFVALIGAPNAGKSTLINALVGEKVSIVTRKAQTTRSIVRGVMTKGEAQIVFVDTPGLFAPKRRLDRAMVASAWSAAADADVVALMIDARKEAGQASLTEETQAILAGLGERGKPKLAVLNKIDLVQRPKLLELSARLNAATTFDDTFMISAATGDGLERLTKRLIELIPPGPWLYPEDQIAEAPIRSLAAEITREKLIERLHDELPYQATVETESWKDLPDGTARIEQTIFVTRESHRKIVLGEGGRTIKAIGTAARKDIAAAHGANVHLFLFVKVRENWLDDPERYRAMDSSSRKDRGGSSPSPRLPGEGRGEGRRGLLRPGLAQPLIRPLRGHLRPGDAAPLPDASSPSPRLRGEGRGEGRRRLLRQGLAQPLIRPLRGHLLPANGEKGERLTAPAEARALMCGH